VVLLTSLPMSGAYVGAARLADARSATPASVAPRDVTASACVRLRWTVKASLVAAALAGCAGDRAAGPSATTASTATTTGPASDVGAQSTAWESDGKAAVVISLRIERRTADPATADFDSAARSTLLDARGWEQADFEFRFDDPDAPYLLVLAEADEVDGLCFPYDTGGLYSCQNGPVVALNADRWRTATPDWTGDLATYRQMLVNHEVGHLLGRHHPPARQCPEPGRPALVMSQQSTELDGCLPNPWPLPEEIAAASRHDEPLAPPYDR